MITLTVFQYINGETTPLRSTEDKEISGDNKQQQLILSSISLIVVYGPYYPFFQFSHLFFAGYSIVVITVLTQKLHHECAMKRFYIERKLYYIPFLLDFLGVLSFSTAWLTILPEFARYGRQTDAIWLIFLGVLSMIACSIAFDITNDFRKQASKPKSNSTEKQSEKDPVAVAV